MISQSQTQETAIAPRDEARAVRHRQLWLTAAILLLAGWLALGFLAPIAWGAVLAIAEWPLFERASRRLPGRPGLVATGLTLATALLVILPLSFAAVTLAQESQGAIDWVQQVQRQGLHEPDWLHGLPLVGSRADAWWREHLGTPQGANALLGGLSAGSIFAWTKSIGGAVAEESVLFLLALLALASLLGRGEAIGRQGRTVMTRMFGEFGTEFLDRMIGAVRATVNGTVLVSVAEGALIGIGYWVAGVPQPLLFAVFTIVLALVPFGAWAAFGLAALILAGTEHVIAGAVLFGFGAAVMTVGDNVIQPSVIGSAVELPFLLAIIGAFGGLAQLGLVGLFVGPVVMAALLLVWRQWMTPPEEATRVEG